MSWMNELRLPIESPRRDTPIKKINEIRATILLWYDLNRFGVSQRVIADCFEVDYSLVRHHINNIPPDVKEAHESEKYMGRIRAAVSEAKGSRPRSGADLRRILQTLGADRV